MTPPFRPAESFESRPVEFLGVATHEKWRIKRYSIVHPESRFEPARFEHPHRIALAMLPQPATSATRPGLAFTIAHQGRGADYLVLCWWDRDNELPMRVWVSIPTRDNGAWSPARGSESICVWDLAVLWFEREAYTRHMLGARGPDPKAYLGETCRSTA